MPIVSVKTQRARVLGCNIVGESMMLARTMTVEIKGYEGQRC